MKQYYVYILTNKGNTVLYTGCSSDLVKRNWQHKNKIVDSFTAKYNINKLVYYEVLYDPQNMIKREKTIKNMVRRKKLALINSVNPRFQDLAEDLI